MRGLIDECVPDERGAGPVCGAAAVGRPRDRRLRHRAFCRRGAGTARCAASTCRPSPLRQHLDEERVIAAFLHAARLGLFEMSWNVLCPACGGVLDANANLKTMRPRRICLRVLRRRLRAEPRRDGRGDVHRQPAVRQIAAHDPDRLPLRIFRQIFWVGRRSAGGNREQLIQRHLPRNRSSCRPASRRILSLQLPEAVHHRLRAGDAFVAVPGGEGEPTRERQNLSLVFNKMHAPLAAWRCAPDRCGWHSRTVRDKRALPGIWIAGERWKPAREAKAVPDGKPPAHQPDVPRHLPHRHDRRRSAPQDHQPDVPVHRSARARPSSTSGSATSSPSTSSGRISGCSTRSSPPRREPW